MIEKFLEENSDKWYVGDSILSADAYYDQQINRIVIKFTTEEYNDKIDMREIRYAFRLEEMPKWVIQYAVKNTCEDIEPISGKWPEMVITNGLPLPNGVEKGIWLVYPSSKKDEMYKSAKLLHLS